MYSMFSLSQMPSMLITQNQRLELVPIEEEDDFTTCIATVEQWDQHGMFTRACGTELSGALYCTEHTEEELEG